MNNCCSCWWNNEQGSVMGNRDSRNHDASEDNTSVPQSANSSRSGRGRDKRLRFEEHAVSKKDLAGCLATLSEMAHTGSGVATEPDPRQSRQPAPDAIKAMSRKLRSKIHRRMSSMDDYTSLEHLDKQLELLDDLEGQDDTHDWASMRSWMVWCMQNNLDDGPEVDSYDTFRPTPPANPATIHRQWSFDQSSSSRRRTRLTQQHSMDSNHLAPVSHSGAAVGDGGQSSFESNASAET